MTVEINFLAFGNLNLAATSFSDTLQTSDPNNSNSATLAGQNWIYAATPMSANGNPNDCPLYSIGASSKDAANALLWTIQGAVNPTGSNSAYLIAAKTYTSLYGKSQFSQCTNVQSSGTAGQGTQNCGLAVMCTPASSNLAGFGFAYVFRVSTDDHSWLLQRLGVATATLTSGAAGTTADGDVLRLSADLSVGGQVTLTVKRNGTVLTSFVDNTANRLLLGSPGLCSIAPSQGAGSPKSDWRTFSCGLGL